MAEIHRGDGYPATDKMLNVILLFYKRQLLVLFVSFSQNIQTFMVKYLLHHDHDVVHFYSLQRTVLTEKKKGRDELAKCLHV